MTQQNKKSNKLWSVLFVLTFIGLIVSAQLIYLHVKVHTDPKFHSACNISATFNCEAVAKSKFAVLAGMPVATWGLIGYLLILLILLAGKNPETRDNKTYGALSLLLVASVAFSGLFFYISHYIIRSLCVACIGSYTTNLALLIVFFALLFTEKISLFAAIGDFLAWLIKNLQYPIVIGFVILSMIAIYPKYWSQTTRISQRTITRGEEAGHYWLGAEKPVLTIVEFSDYECPYCRLYHALVRSVLDRHPKQIRLIHKHFPLDQKCNPMITRRFHKNACLFSRAAICAGKQGKFWKMNDIIYTHKDKLDNQEALVERIKALKLDPTHFRSCLDAEYTKTSLLKDIKEGIKKGIRGTPTFYINGKKFSSRMSRFEKNVEALLEKTIEANKKPKKSKK